MTRPGAAIVCAVMLCASGAAYANNPPALVSAGVVLHTRAGQIAETDAKPGAAAQVAPGETVTITGDCVMPEESADDLRVVLTLADEASGSTPGFRSVLATDQVVRRDGLEVRVPDMPRLCNEACAEAGVS